MGLYHPSKIITSCKIEYIPNGDEEFHSTMFATKKNPSLAPLCDTYPKVRLAHTANKGSLEGKQLLHFEYLSVTYH
jgi:hypothetical protein